MTLLPRLRLWFTTWFKAHLARRARLSIDRDQRALDRKLLRDKQRLQRQTLIPYGRAKVEQDDRSWSRRF